MKKKSGKVGDYASYIELSNVMAERMKYLYLLVLTDGCLRQEPHGRNLNYKFMMVVVRYDGFCYLMLHSSFSFLVFLLSVSNFALFIPIANEFFWLQMK